MKKLLLLFSLFTMITCSAEKPSDMNKQTTSGLPAADISPSGGKQPTDAARNTIKNNPPELSRVKLMPEVFKPGDRLYIDATGSDVDNDEVNIIYEWSLNGTPAGNSREIDAQIKRGDRISVKITPYDGKTYGRTIIINKEIKNMQPVITEDNVLIFDGNTCTYQIKASDPDDDELTYSLKTAPDGMTVDSSGLIRWDVPPDFKGKAPVTVSVLDGNGGEAALTFNVNIHTEKNKP